MFSYLVLFCCDLQSALTKPKPPLPSSSSSLVMSPLGGSALSSGYEAGSSERLTEETVENVEIEALKGQVAALSDTLQCSQKEIAKLKGCLQNAYLSHVELKARLNDADKCNTSVLIGATSFVCTFCCIVFCLSPSCDTKIIKFSGQTI